MTQIRSILVVCSGNTCRSPMAATILKGMFSHEPELAAIRVASAGTSAWEGLPAAEGAFLVAMERGLDLSEHRSQAITREIVQDVDLILTMTRAHRERVNELGGEGKTHTLVEYSGIDLEEADVPDPFGGDVADYRDVADTLVDMLTLAVMRLHKDSGR